MSIEPAASPGGPGDGASPYGDDRWGQDAVLDELMAAFGPGEDQALPDDGFDLELDEFMTDPGFMADSGFMANLESQPRRSRTEGTDDGTADGTTGETVGESADQTADERATVAPECLDAGFLPRGGTGRPRIRRLAGGGCGAGFASGAELDTSLPGPALAGFADAAAGDDRRYTDLNDDELIGTLAGWQKTESWAASGKLSAVTELIRRRPIQPGRSNGPDEVPAGWGEFCSDELAAALAITKRAAERMLEVAYDLAFRLPRTCRALREGRIDSYKAQIIAEMTRLLDDAGAAAAEALILEGITDLSDKTPPQIRARVGRAIVRINPDAARQRRERAQRDAQVRLWREDEGTAALGGFGLPPAEALAADQMISSRAQELRAAGLEGTLDQLRVRAYLDVLLGQDSSPILADDDPSRRPPADSASTNRSGSTDKGCGTDKGGSTHEGATADKGASNETRLAARINLTVPLATLLGLAERPGEMGGFGPIDPELARTLATTAASHPATIWCLTVTDAHGHPTAHGCARPVRRVGRPQPGSRAGPGQGPGARPPGRADQGGKLGRDGRLDGYGTWRLRPVADGPDLTIDLEPLAVTDCDHRHQTSAHDPSDRLRHLVEIRDEECTWPPCRRAARRCDFEHTIPWEAGGPTCACNTGPRCRHHHRQKQAQGWKLSQDLPGYHTWTTPAGRVYTSGPVSYPI